MATTVESPAGRHDALAGVAALFSRLAQPLPPLQFTGAAGSRYNMGGGQPDPASLPRRELAEIVAAMLAAEDGFTPLLYGDAAGDRGLREVLAEKLRRTEGIEATPDEVLVTNGSNHGLAVVAQTFINPGETAIVEAPTFMGGLRPLRHLQAKIEPVPLDEYGLRVDVLEERLRRLRAAGTPAKLLYTIPNFHNPAGVDLSLERRRRIAELADEFNFVILEDDAYGELRFAGEHAPSLYRLAARGRVVRAATLSKILAAGLRIGYLTAPPEVLARINSLKLDGGASPFTNRLAARWLRAHHDEHVQRLIGIYRAKRDALVRGLESGFAPGDPLKPQWHLPNGGFFLWLRLAPGVDPARLAQEAASRGIGYVPGTAFFADGSGSDYIRLAWSMLSPEDLETAGRLLAEAMHAAAR